MDQPAPNPIASWPPQRIARATLTVLVILAAFWVLFEFRLVFFSLFTAIVLSTAIKPAVDRLFAWKVSRPVGVILITLVALIALIAVILLIVPLIVEQWATMTALLSEWYRELRQNLLNSESLLLRRIVNQMPRFLPLTLPQPDLDAVDEDSLSQVEQAFNLTTSILRSLLLLIGVGLLSNFWILEGDRATRLLLMAAPQNRREGIREFISDVEMKVGAYTRGLILLSLIIGALALAAYLLIGLPNVLLLAIIAGIAEAIPLIGPLLGAIPALAVAASTDPTKVIWVALATFVIQLLENNLIVPRVMDRAVGVNPVASLLAFIAFGSIFGLVGALLAIPLAAVIQLVLNRFVFNVSPTEQVPVLGRDAVSTLRYEAQDLVNDVRKQMRERETESDETAEHVEDAMEAIVQDLDSILAGFEQPGAGNGRGDRPS